MSDNRPDHQNASASHRNFLKTTDIFSGALAGGLLTEQAAASTVAASSVASSNVPSSKTGAFGVPFNPATADGVPNPSPAEHASTDGDSQPRRASID